MTYVALVTGASSGIGEAVARRLARDPSGAVRLVLVARREERLRALAGQLGDDTLVIGADLGGPGAASRIAAEVEHECGALHLVVNNAGASWRGTFADTGWVNVARHMQINFEGPVRLVEALLPLLRHTARGLRTPAGAGTPRPGVVDPPPPIAHAAPVAIVNVASTAGRVSRPAAGAYSASKFALAGWTDALRAEEAPHGVHVGLVLPGFVATEGFPATELRSHPLARFIVSTPEKAAEAILQAGPGGKAERYVPRYYWLAAATRILAPALTRRATAGGRFTTSTPASEELSESG